MGNWPALSQCVFGATNSDLHSNEWMNEWVSVTQEGGRGRRHVHVRPTRLASHDKLWDQFIFWNWKMWDSIRILTEDNNNDDIIMMVIKRWKTYFGRCYTSSHARWHSCGQSCTGRLDKSACISRAPLGVGTPVSGTNALLQQSLDALVTLLYITRQVTCPGKTLTSLSCLEHLHW